MIETTLTPEALAQLFHETYERLAPVYGYETRKASAVPWQNVPITNKRLMIAVAADVLTVLTNEAVPPQAEREELLLMKAMNARLLGKTEALWQLIERFDAYLQRAVPHAYEFDADLGAIRVQMQTFK
jgi:hypothetical protein